MRASRRPASLLARLTAPTIRYVDSEGARLRGDLFAVGSGGEYAYGVLDAVAHGRRERAEDGATADRAGGGRDGGLAELDAEQAVAVALEARSAPGRGASGATVSVTVSSPTPSSRAVQALAASTARDAYSGGFVNGARVPRFSRARSRGPNQRAFPICPPPRVAPVLCVPRAGCGGWRHVLRHDLGAGDGWPYDQPHAARVVARRLAREALASEADLMPARSDASPPAAPESDTPDEAAAS